MSNPFPPAYAIVQDVESIVGQRISQAQGTATQLTSTAMSTISSLSNVDLDFNVGALPAPPKIENRVNVELDLGSISPTSFGQVGTALPTVPSLESPPDIPDINLPDFHSSIAGFNLPSAPTVTLPSAPTRPNVHTTIDYPTAPSLALPPMPTMQELSVPTFAGLTLPAFSATAPEFQGSALPGILQWAEPTYKLEILDEMMDKVRTLWSGGSGIPPAVEAAMFARASEREELSTSRDLDSMSEEYSMRGFTMPSGMQASREDQMRLELSTKKLGLNRELTIQIAQWQIENIRFACEQSVAAENVLVNIFLNQAARAFDAAKYQIETQLNVYNMQVALFNAKMNGYQVSAQVFNTLVQAELSKVEVFKAQIEAEVARGEINKQKVAVYSAQIEALRSQTELYRTQMQGAEIRSQVLRNQIEIYKSDVEAYAQSVAAQKTVFDVYDTQVKAETSKAGIIDAEARAYSALVQGKTAAVDAGIKKAEVAIQRNRMALEGYQSALEAQKATIQAQLGTIQASAQAYTADTQRFSAKAQAETAKAQLEVSAKEAEIRSNIAFYQAQTQAYISNMEQLIRKAAVAVDALKAAGGIASTLAAGAMAGVHVGANLSGSGAVSAAGSQSESFSVSQSQSRNENHNYEGT